MFGACIIQVVLVYLLITSQSYRVWLNARGKVSEALSGVIAFFAAAGEVLVVSCHRYRAVV